MLSGFLTIASRESAIKTIRRASAFFIFISSFDLALKLFGLFDAWSVSQVRGNSTTSFEIVGGLVGSLFAGLTYYGWSNVILVLNGFVLHLYKSRLAALLYVLFGLYGMAFVLLIIWQGLPVRSPVSGRLVFMDSWLASWLVMVCGLNVWIAGRALAAAIKLRGEFKDDPVAAPTVTN